MSRYKTDLVMTPSEYAKILSVRVSQLTKGAEPMIPVDKYDAYGIPIQIDPFKIAHDEIHSKKCDLYVVRDLGNGQKETIPVSQLDILHF